MNAEVECPLCSQIGFRSVDALRVALVSVASRNLKCPVCFESVTGLDKFTIHLFGHTIPQHELYSAPQPALTNITIPHMNASVTHCSVVEPTTVTPQEPKKKVDVTPFSEIPTQSFQSFQNETTSSKTASTPIVSQDLSNLFCWLPVTSLSEKLSNCTTSNTAPASSNLILSGTIAHSQENDEKGENINRQSLTTLENNVLNKDASFIILSLPSLQDMRKQFDLREISNNIKNNTNNLNPSDISTLAGKLLMLDCSGNTQCPSSVSTSNLSEQSRVQIAVLPEPQNPAHAQSDETLPLNQNPCLPKRDVSTSVDIGNLEDNNVEQSKQNTEGEPAKSSNEVLKCNLCFSQFTDPNILTLHQQLVHEGSNSFQSRFTTSPEEASSKQEGDPTEGKDEETFQCHMCSKTFQMQGSLMVHLRVAHTTPTMIGLASRIKESISEQPSVVSVTASKNTKDHPQAKSCDNKQWECGDCGKFFTTKYFLKKHKRLHTGEMPYSCPKCNKSFTFQQSYHKHLLYHSDEKPHTCADCGRSFKELSTLHNHQRIHTGEKPWACETCGKCFRQRVSYLVHRRIHTGAMPYSCTACNKSFRYKVSQRTHKCVAQPAGTATVLAQPASAVTSQVGCLLERLLFEQPSESQEKPRGDTQDEQKERSTLSQQTQQEKLQSLISQSNHQTNSRLVFTSYNDKTIFHRRLEPSTSDFNLHNFQLQQTISPVQGGSGLLQKAVVHGNVAMTLKEELKQNVVSENSRINTVSWCPDKQSSPGQNIDSSSLVVLVRDKEMISTSVPDSSVPVSLLQVLQKDKYTPKNEFHSQTSVNMNDLQASAACQESVKVGNSVLSNPFVPDFLSLALSGPNPINQDQVTGCGSSNVSMGNEPFQWNVSAGHDHNSITDNVTATQETIDSLQSLLFGSQSTELR